MVQHVIRQIQTLIARTRRSPCGRDVDKDERRCGTVFGNDDARRVPWDVAVANNSEIFLEITGEPASGSYAVVARQIIGRGHCKIIRHGASAAVPDDDLVATRGRLIGGPVVGKHTLGGGGIAAQGHQEQGDEADDETSPGVLTGNANFQGTSVHGSFRVAAIPPWRRS